MRFILIDKILELTPGESVRAIRFVDPSDDYFRDHFPGFPVVPGVLLTEMMAQTAGKCLDAERRPRGKAMLAKIRSASFRKWVTPGQTVTLSAVVKSNDERFATVDCKAEVDGAKVAQADLLLSFVTVDTLADGYRDELLEEYLSQSQGSQEPQEPAKPEE